MFSPYNLSRSDEDLGPEILMAQMRAEAPFMPSSIRPRTT